MKRKKKEELLLDCQKCEGKMIVFVGRRQDAEEICNHLSNHNIKAGSLHGQMNQYQREEAILQFKDDQYRILCATSVAARGLDFPCIESVINYDMPPNLENYVHRIGRTGRIGSSGIAISYFNHSSKSICNPIVDFLLKHKQEVPVWLQKMADKKRKYRNHSDRSNNTRSNSRSRKHYSGRR